MNKQQVPAYIRYMSCLASNSALILQEFLQTISTRLLGVVMAELVSTTLYPTSYISEKLLALWDFTSLGLLASLRTAILGVLLHSQTYQGMLSRRCSQLEIIVSN